MGFHTMNKQGHSRRTPWVFGKNQSPLSQISKAWIPCDFGSCSKLNVARHYDEKTTLTDVITWVPKHVVRVVLFAGFLVWFHHHVNSSKEKS